MLNLFFTALMVYTRLPVPKGIDHSEEALNRSTVFFPLIGWIVGGIGVGTYWIGQILFPPELAVLLSMISTICATGAFHEDGFGDVCDGFGGGWNKAKILAIMKDSRLGTYGVIGLGLLLAVKFFALMKLLPAEPFGLRVALKVISAHTLSRWIATTVIAAMPYARDDEQSKVRPIARGGIASGPLAVATLFGLAPTLVLVAISGLWIYLTFLIPLWLVRWRLMAFFAKWLGGYTGDCLGATQQLTEVVVYLSYVSLVWVSI